MNNRISGEIVQTNISYPYNIMQQDISELRAKYPFIQVGNIGYSVLGKVIPFPFDPNRDFSVFFENDVVISWVRSSVGDIFFGLENSMDGFYPAVRQMISRMFLITTVLLFFGFFIAFGMSAYVTQPIKQVTKQMSDMIRIKDKSTKKGLEEIADAICTEFHTLEEFIKRNREIIKSNYILNLYLNQCNRIKSLEEKKVYIDF